MLGERSTVIIDVGAGKPGQSAASCDSFAEKCEAGLGTKGTEQSKGEGADPEGLQCKKVVLGFGVKL